jgi:hypothetical protein
VHIQKSDNTVILAYTSNTCTILLIFIYFYCAFTEPIIPYKRTESHNSQRLPVPLYCILMVLLGARTPYLLSIGKCGFHTCSHPYGGCVGKATMVRTIVVKTHGRQKLNPTPVEPPTVQHLPLEHACSIHVLYCPSPTGVANHRVSTYWNPHNFL